MYNVSPETVLQRQQRQQRPTIEGLAREHSAKAALRTLYEQKARKVGMTLSSYCLRFGIKVPV